MNLDIETDHVAMRPEWHHMIDAWVERCRKYHPAVGGIDVTLRHSDDREREMEVDAVATAGPRSLRATRQAEAMTVALHDALDALEYEILVHEAVSRPAREAA